MVTPATGRDAYAAGFALERIGYLATELKDDPLVRE
jgi:hypothetical protein